MPTYPEYTSPDGRTRLATSKADEVRMKFDGWVPTDSLRTRHRGAPTSPAARPATGASNRSTETSSE